MSRFRLVHRGRASAGVTTAFTYDNSIGVNPVDSSGFADLPKHATGKYVFVGAGGNDANNGLTHATRKLTPAAGLALISDSVANGDQLLFAEGSVFTSTLPSLGFYVGGLSLQYPLVLQSYDPSDPTNTAKYGRANGSDSHARPKFTGDTTTSSFMFTGTQSNIAIRGLDIDPGDIANQGVLCVSVGSGILFENNIFRNCDLAINAVGASHWILRLNSVYGAWSTTPIDGSHARHGFYVNGCDSITVEDNVGYHYGWRISTGTRGDGNTAGNASAFSHFVYVQDTGNTTACVRRNLISDGAADGGSLRSHSVFQDNVSLANPIALSIGGNDYDMNQPYGISLDVSYNFFLGTSDVNSLVARGYGIDSFNGKSFSLGQYNVLSHGPGSGGGGTPHALRVGIADSTYTQDSWHTFDHCVIRNWLAPGGNVANTAITTAAGSSATCHLIVTNTAWDDAPSGSNIAVSGVTYPNPYDETSLPVAAGYADRATMMNHFINFPEEMPARSLASLARSGYAITKPAKDLAWESSTWGTGVAQSTVIVGTRDGDVLSAPSGLPSFVTLHSDGRSLLYDGTPTTASSGNITIRATAADGSTHDTTQAYTVTLLPLLTSGGSITHGTTTATLPVTTTGTDGDLYWLIINPATEQALGVPLCPNQIVKHFPFNNSRISYAHHGSSAVTAAGTYNLSATGLTSATTYHAYAAHKMAGGLLSKVIDLGTFTTS